jgi:hypothetical protein
MGNDLTFPANGIPKILIQFSRLLNGSVQNIPSFDKIINELFTASVNSIGSSGGTTDVILCH